MFRRTWTSSSSVRTATLGGDGHGSTRSASAARGRGTDSDTGRPAGRPVLEGARSSGEAPPGATYTGGAAEASARRASANGRGTSSTRSSPVRIRPARPQARGDGPEGRCAAAVGSVDCRALSRASGRGTQAFARPEVLVGELGIERGPELATQAAILSQSDLSSVGRQMRSLWFQPCVPYKGLARSERVDAGFFFGREQVVAEAIGHLVGEVLALVGPSGSGNPLCCGRDSCMHSDRARFRRRSVGLLVIHRATVRCALGDALNERRELSMLAVDQFEESSPRAPMSTSGPRSSTPSPGPHAGRHHHDRHRVRADFYGRCAEHRGLASFWPPTRSWSGRWTRTGCGAIDPAQQRT
jgi:hypothetical protein